jgi:hypothetical protein
MIGYIILLCVVSGNVENKASFTRHHEETRAGLFRFRYSVCLHEIGTKLDESTIEIMFVCRISNMEFCQFIINILPAGLFIQLIQKRLSFAHLEL